MAIVRRPHCLVNVEVRTVDLCGVRTRLIKVAHCGPWMGQHVYRWNARRQESLWRLRARSYTNERSFFFITVPPKPGMRPYATIL